MTLSALVRNALSARAKMHPKKKKYALLKAKKTRPIQSSRGKTLLLQNRVQKVQKA
jgi:hypothetical protein